MKDDVAEIKALLQANVATLAMALAPDGYKAGRYWIARNPTRHDTKAGSFVVWLTGAPGAWKDYATDDKGDVLKLIQYVHGCDFAEAMKWARSWLGIDRLSDDFKRKAVQRVAAEAERHKAAEQAELERQRRSAFAIWLQSWERIAGTKAETYLRQRAIDIHKLPRPPRALRFAPAMRHVESDRDWPCMIAGMFSAAGVLVAIHRTWLAADGSGKAPVTPARKIWPRGWQGAIIPIARGAGGLSTAEAERRGIKGRLVLVEGIEDALTVALAHPDLRVWAVCALSNLRHIVLPACVDEVIVGADNDWGKPQAAKLLDAGLDALQAQGRPVRVARATVGKDFNDQLRGAA